MNAIEAMQMTANDIRELKEEIERLRARVRDLERQREAARAALMRILGSPTPREARGHGGKD